MSRVVIVHGVRNHQRGLSASEAAERLASRWRQQLTAGYQDARLGHLAIPEITAAYYADALHDSESQGAAQGLEDLSPAEQLAVLDWLSALGMPDGLAEGQSWGRLPLRQTLDLVARKRGVAAQTLARIAVAIMPEVYSYLASPKRRRNAQEAVAQAVKESGAKVVMAHSLGSIVVYETLHTFDGLGVEALITLGSPLGLSGAVFDMLDPAPVAGHGKRPPGLSHWLNIADAGDLVALPRRLGDRFPVDVHGETHMALADFHTLDMYLACGLTAAGLSPHCAP
ncbi:serine peptidase [Streptomyces bauhiniae]|uniref:Serine peptidase n=1 Tax=Streptomyces bauhiniae TaxID=2340725 RepID=A0A7K3QYD6_9ACTN|nr:serine peptidase [Streptomyces bauhiniae]NEB94928.1 serine peptidase [Streptomyces bauhiniae]